MKGVVADNNYMVELRGVTKRFGAVTAVDDVSLQIRPGEFLTLLGPSGCGKTTLLRMISGFETPDAGSVLLEGRDVTALPPYHRDVNQVFQSYALFPHLNVWQNICFGLRLKRLKGAEIRRRAVDAIDLVALAGLERRKPSELSGGQRQRVALARALVCQPKVLLLDEPLAALDAKLRRSMQVELKRLQQRLGITIVFVTHDQEEALTMSDRIAVIHEGRLEQLGDTADVYHRPCSAFAADFLGHANIFPFEPVMTDGRLTGVRLAGGLELTLAPSQNPAWNPASSGNWRISMRSEKILLHRIAPEEPNVFEAEVREELFRARWIKFWCAYRPAWS